MTMFQDQGPSMFYYKITTRLPWSLSYLLYILVLTTEYMSHLLYPSRPIS